jgi:hypothetical protein
MPKLKKLRLSKDLPGVNLYRKDKFAFVFRNIGLTAKRVKTDAAFAATRAKATAFAGSATIAGHIYRAIKESASHLDGKDCYRRILARTVSAMPPFVTTQGPVQYIGLSGFQCNTHAFPQRALHALCSMDHITGQKIITARIPALFPPTDINGPWGATHFKLSLLLAIIYTDTGEKVSTLASHPILFQLALPMKRPLEATLKINIHRPAIILAAVKIAFCSGDGFCFHTWNHGTRDTFDIIACRTLLPCP